MNNVLQMECIRSSTQACNDERYPLFWRGLWQKLELWSDRRWQRRDLRRLNDHILKDIGLSRADVERESAKFFWKE